MYLNPDAEAYLYLPCDGLGCHIWRVAWVSALKQKPSFTRQEAALNLCGRSTGRCHEKGGRWELSCAGNVFGRQV